MPASVSILIAFGLIAGLAIVLRWTYGNDLAERRGRSSANRTPSVDEGPTGATGSTLLEPSPVIGNGSTHATLGSGTGQVPDGRHETIEPAGRDDLVGAADSADEGFGLLRTVLVADNDRQAALVREVLREAGIRSTTAVRPTGISVLVFADQLDQAHRLVG